jgi:NTP pyrophosphatase (non-canonical NTP hydrolase)
MMDKYVAKLALIHSEVTEILEALRKSQGSDKVTEEFADVLIRTYDLYGELVNAGEADPELYAVMMKKIETNKTRPAKHGNRWG